MLEIYNSKILSSKFSQLIKNELKTFGINKKKRMRKKHVEKNCDLKWDVDRQILPDLIHYRKSNGARFFNQN